MKQVRLRRRKINVPKDCFFCKEKKTPWYADVATLQKFLTERSKIIGRERSGTCAKHQRRLTLAIKQSRFLSLLPFTG